MKARGLKVVYALATVGLLLAAAMSLEGCRRRTVCGDGVCSPGETSASCGQDCGGPTCGDGLCEAGETAATCPTDCGVGPVCGDGTCDAGETTASCPGDCPATLCGNGTCEVGETNANCPADCMDTCGNGICAATENDLSCAPDCGCQGAASCAATAPGGCECDAACVGAGDCCADACTVCGSCAAGGCGDGFCTGGTETNTSCPADCTAPGGWTCMAAYYAGGPADGCDCGCGAPDPDCDDIGVVGCLTPDCCTTGNCMGCAWCWPTLAPMAECM